MGVVQRQGIKDSIVAYAGVALGAVNTLFIYTLLPKEILGLFQYLVSTALIIATLLQLGMTNVALRFFPVFKTQDNRHNGFLFLLLMPAVAGFTLFAIILLLLSSSIRDTLLQRGTDPLVQQFLLFLIPLAFFMVFNMILAQYTKNFLRIVIPTLLENVWIKIATGALALLFAYGVIQLFGFIAGIVAAYGVVMLGLMFYLRWLGQLYLKPNFSLLDRPLLRRMGIFAFYGILGSVGGSLMTYVDRAMIPHLIPGSAGLAANGIFTIVAYIGTTIDIPRKSIEKITAPVVASAIEQNDWLHVADLYKRSSVNLLIIGMLLFLGIWLNIDSVFDIMQNGEAYRAAKNIVFILGISSLIDMVTSINSHIIWYSRYFRYAFYLIVVLAGLNVLFNYLFIKTFGWGIQGAALATLSSIFIFNTAKFLFIYRIFKIQPFTRATFWVLLIGAAVFGVGTVLPDTGITLADVLYKSFIITSLYLIPILYFRLSPDLNLLLSKIWATAKKRLHF